MSETDILDARVQPTAEQLKLAYEQEGSLDLAVAFLKKRGFKTSKGTAQRVMKNGWRYPKDNPKDTPEQKAAKAVDTALAQVTDAEKQMAATAEDVAITELEALEDVELQRKFKRQVMITSIMGLQTAARNSDLLIKLSAKDFGAMVADMASSISSARVVEHKGAPLAAGDGAKLIEGTATTIEPPRPVSATVTALERLRAQRAASK